MASMEWLSKLLEQESFYHYHAYYKEVRHNHKAHGAVAIALLGGTPQEVQEYFDFCNQDWPKYEKEAPLTEVQEIDRINSDKLEDYRGKHQGFYKILGFLTDVLKEKYNDDIYAMIKGECPPIIDGPLASAFHGVIQLAYGIAGNHKQAMLEGIAFTYHQYSPWFPAQPDNPKRNDLSKIGKGKREMMDIIKELSENSDLVQALQDETKEGQKPDFSGEYFQGSFCWSGTTYHSDLFLDLTDDLKYPESFDPSAKDMKQLEVVMDWICDMASVLYVEIATVNDFFVLHGITGAWSLKQVLPLLKYDDALRGLRASIASLFAVYVYQGAPAIVKKPEDFYDGEVTQEAWDELIKKTLKEKDNHETHVFKVIQCLYDFWKSRPSSPYARHYFAGAYLSTIHTWSFFREDLMAIKAYKYG